MNCKSTSQFSIKHPNEIFKSLIGVTCDNFRNTYRNCFIIVILQIYWRYGENFY